MTTFPDRLKKTLNGALPGPAGQNLMAPTNRLDIKRQNKLDSVLSAVLLCIYPYQDEWYICFLKRAAGLSVHSGQISFPGGKYERDDIVLVHTAIREAKEELNIECDEKQIIGTLSSLFVPPSKSYIHPFVACLSHAPDFKPDPSEVAELIEVRLKDLFDPSLKRTLIKELNGEKVLIPYYDVSNHQIWGATAMILSEFEQIFIKSELLPE
jgi:8-oxo-dGTP pyrophosphatase MutT (NUDIX family)